MAEGAFERATAPDETRVPAQLAAELTPDQLLGEERHHAFVESLGENGSGARHLDTLGYVDLAPIAAGERAPERPTLITRGDDRCLIYRGRATCANGEPGTGKSFLADHAVAESLRAGRGAVVIDYEGTADTLVDRLRTLGVDDAVFADPHRLVYLRPLGKLTDPAVRFVGVLARLVDADVIVVDAVGPAMAAAGLEENSNSDFAGWFTRVVRPLLDQPWAVLLIDHVSRNPQTRTRGARGASAKLQLVDLSLAARTVQPFSRTRAGSFKLTCEKDRFGNYAMGETVAVVRVDPDADPILTVEAPGDDTTGPDWQPTGLMEKLSRALEARTARADESGDPLPNREETLALITGRAEYRRQALDALIAADHVERQKDGRHTRHRSLAPYREPGPSSPETPVATSTPDHGPDGPLGGTGTVVGDRRPEAVDHGPGPSSDRRGTGDRHREGEA